jgi:hypothetical protein
MQLASVGTEYVADNATLYFRDIVISMQAIDLVPDRRSKSLDEGVVTQGFSCSIRESCEVLGREADPRSAFVYCRDRC